MDMPVEFKDKFFTEFIRGYEGDYMIVCKKKLAKTVKNELGDLGLLEHTVQFDHSIEESPTLTERLSSCCRATKI